MAKNQNPKRYFDGVVFQRLRKRFSLSFAECGRQVGVGQAAIKNYEEGTCTPSLPSFREIIRVFNLGMAETFQLLKLAPPGVSFQEFHKFLATCRQEQLPPAKVLADFIRAYAES